MAGEGGGSFTTEAGTQQPYSTSSRTANGAIEPKLKIEKGLTYSQATNDLLLDISADANESASKTGVIEKVKVTNVSDIPAVAIFKFNQWTAEATIGAVNHLHVLLNPSEVIEMPAQRMILVDDDNELYDGTVVANVAPDGNMYTDSTADVDSATANGVVNSSSSTTLYLEPYSDADTCTANLFRIGDIIRIRDEIMEVTAIGDKSSLANNTLTVTRGLYGSTAVTAAADDDPVRFAFFNQHYDYDKFTTPRADGQGKFKCSNFFGYGRATTVLSGITAGSIAIKQYEAGYQNLTQSGDITGATETGLSASTAYYLTIAVDGGSTIEINFTTSTNTKFGGTDGLISKIQEALNTQYYTAGNLFEKRVTVAIVNGDVRFTSGQHLSTSAIALTAGTSGSGASVRFLAQANGRIPALANIPVAVAAKLPDDTTYDPVTYGETYSDKFIKDDK